MRASQMSKAEFIAAHYHELFGVIADAAVEGRRGAELSLWLRQQQVKLQDRLGRAYDSLIPPAPPPAKPAANGQPTQSATRPQGAAK